MLKQKANPYKIYDTAENKLLMWLKLRVDECRGTEFQKGQMIAFAEVAEKVEEIFREESCLNAQNEQGMRESD